MKQAEQLLDALIKKYLAQKAEGLAILNLYTNQSVGVGEHPDILGEMDKAITKISDAEGKIELIAKMLPREDGETTDGSE